MSQRRSDLAHTLMQRRHVAKPATVPHRYWENHDKFHCDLYTTLKLLTCLFFWAVCFQLMSDCSGNFFQTILILTSTASCVISENKTDKLSLKEKTCH